MPQTVSAELEQLFDASLQSGEQWEMDRDPPIKEGGTRKEDHSTLDIFLVSFQAIHKKEYFPALGFSEAMKPWGSSLLFI